VFTVYQQIYRRILPTEFSIGNSVGKNDTSSFFLLCFNFFSHDNSLGLYRGNISVGKIPRKFTDENIPLVFPFVFINFLVVGTDLLKHFKVMNLLLLSRMNDLSLIFYYSSLIQLECMQYASQKFNNTTLVRCTSKLRSLNKKYTKNQIFLMRSKQHQRI